MRIESLQPGKRGLGLSAAQLCLEQLITQGLHVSVALDDQHAHHVVLLDCNPRTCRGVSLPHAIRLRVTQGLGRGAPERWMSPVVILPSTAAALAVAPTNSIDVLPPRTRFAFTIATLVARTTARSVFRRASTRLSLNRHSPAAEILTAGAAPRAFNTLPRTEPRGNSGSLFAPTAAPAMTDT